FEFVSKSSTNQAVASPQRRYNCQVSLRDFQGIMRSFLVIQACGKGINHQYLKVYIVILFLVASMVHFSDRHPAAERL
ncbi:MAG: hypothetical protein KGK08_09560, partial [Acidobacteriota bacterium]|nr:hypothetical protein [Acidobacteriota bacterium]